MQKRNSICWMAMTRRIKRRSPHTNWPELFDPFTPSSQRHWRRSCAKSRIVSNRPTSFWLAADSELQLWRCERGLKLCSQHMNWTDQWPEQADQALTGLLCINWLHTLQRNWVVVVNTWYPSGTVPAGVCHSCEVRTFWTLFFAWTLWTLL